MESIIPNGFRKCGLFPLNVEAVDFARLFNRLKEQTSTDVQNTEISGTVEPEIILMGLKNLIPHNT